MQMQVSEMDPRHHSRKTAEQHDEEEPYGGDSTSYAPSGQSKQHSYAYTLPPNNDNDNDDQLLAPHPPTKKNAMMMGDSISSDTNSNTAGLVCLVEAEPTGFYRAPASWTHDGRDGGQRHHHHHHARYYNTTTTSLSGSMSLSSDAYIHSTTTYYDSGESDLGKLTQWRIQKALNRLEPKPRGLADSNTDDSKNNSFSSAQSSAILFFASLNSSTTGEELVKPPGIPPWKHASPSLAAAANATAKHLCY